MNLNNGEFFSSLFGGEEVKVYNIGYFSLSEEKDSERNKGIEKRRYKIHSITEEHFNKIEHLDVLLLEESKPSDINQVCEILMNVRKRSNILVWILAHPDVAVRKNRIVYLKLGADGVIDHTDNWEELSLVLKNAINRHYFPQFVNKKMLKKEDEKRKKEESIFKLIPENFSVRIENGEEISLTKLEYKVIEYLYENKQKVVSYEELYQSLWTGDCNELKYRICNLIFHLRKKNTTN